MSTTIETTYPTTLYFLRARAAGVHPDVIETVRAQGHTTEDAIIRALHAEVWRLRRAGDDRGRLAP